MFYGSCSESASGISRAVTGTMTISVAHSPIPGLTEAEGLERLRRLVEYRTDLAATRGPWREVGERRMNWRCPSPSFYAVQAQSRNLYGAGQYVEVILVRVLSNYA